MTKTVFYSATTLDGFLADEHDSLDWLFKQDQDESGPLNYDDFIAGIGAVVMGRTTYEWIRERIVRGEESWPYRQPSWVLTHADLLEVEGAEIRFAQGDVRDVHAAMVAAAGGQDLWVVGGGDLAGQFAEAGLLDELILYIAPVTLGSGRPLLPRRWDLELVELAQNRSFACVRYQVVGPLSTDAAT